MLLFPVMALIGSATEAGFNAMNAALKAGVEGGHSNQIGVRIHDAVLPAGRCLGFIGVPEAGLGTLFQRACGSV